MSKSGVKVIVLFGEINVGCTQRVSDGSNAYNSMSLEGERGKK